MITNTPTSSQLASCLRASALELELAVLATRELVQATGEAGGAQIVDHLLWGVA